MNLRTLLAVGLAALLMSAGVGAATGSTATQSSAEDVDELETNYDVTAAYDNGSVTLTVTANGSGVEGIDVYLDEELVGTTDANGTVTFEHELEDDLEVTLEREEVVTELEFEYEDGELKLENGAFEPAGDSTDASEAEDDSDRAGPPSSIPGVAPDHVEEIHDLIHQHLNGSLDGSLGEAVSQVVNDERAGQSEEGEANEQADDNADRTPVTEDGTPVDDDDERDESDVDKES